MYTEACNGTCQKMYSTIHKSALSQQINSTFLFQNREISTF